MEFFNELAELFVRFVDIFLHLDTHLNEWATALGPWLYVLLFTIVFCETGLVVTPFLPGDSLLFAVGALSAIPGSPIDLVLVNALLMIAAVLGDATNYSIGARIGPKVFAQENSKWLNKKHLEKTHQFYEKYGGKTIIIARFMPIVRTFAPFVAGIGRMTYRKFAAFNIAGGVAWVALFSVAGFAFGNLPIVKRYFQLVILGIIVVSVLPALIEVLRELRAAKKAQPAA